MNSSEYFAKRFEKIENELNKSSKSAYNILEKEINKANAQINSDIEKWYYRIANNNEMSLLDAKKLLNKNELSEFKWSVNKYIETAKENELSGAWIKELENASAKVHISRLEALRISNQQQLEKAFGNQLDLVDNLARKTFTDSYYKSIYEVQKGFSVGFDVAMIDSNKLSKIVASPWATDGKNFSNRVWQNKTTMINSLTSELTRNCVLGGDPKKAITNMQRFANKQCKNAKYVASRLIYTEQAYFASEGQKQAFKDLDVEEYEIVATLDSSTSSVCQEMDGKHYKMTEFVIGATAPPFHPFCRTVTVPYFDDEFSQDDLRASRGSDGKTDYVPANMKYSEWYDKYVIDELTKGSGNGIIQVTKVISGHKSAPMQSSPNAVIDHLGGNGKTETRTFYSDVGVRLKDITNHGHGNLKNHPYGTNGEHAHDWIYDQEKIVKTTRAITDKERKENGDML